MPAELKPEISEAIKIAADSAFRQLADELGTWHSYRRQVCLSASLAMVRNLEVLGIQATQRISNRRPELSPPIHSTCFIPEEGGIVIDLTYKQFLLESTDHLPNVLVCRVADLPATLTSLGIPAEKHRYWLDAA